MKLMEPPTAMVMARPMHFDLSVFSWSKPKKKKNGKTKREADLKQPNEVRSVAHDDDTRGAILLDVRRHPLEHHKRRDSHAASSRLSPRRVPGAFEEEISNDQIGYFAAINIGTPPQQVLLHLDTGSADIWVPSSTADACEPGDDGDENKCEHGTFTPANSQTFEDLNTPFEALYYDNSFVRGTYFTDTMDIGGAVIHDMPAGLGLQTDIPFGLAGIGYKRNSRTIGAREIVNDNLPVRMQKQGLINTVAYSLWLNDLRADKGSILFGGIDRAKFEGPMKTVPVLKTARGKYDFFMVALYSLGISGPGFAQNALGAGNIPVILDSGATMTYLPNELAQPIYREFGVDFLNDIDVPVVPCDRASGEETVTFRFGSDDGPAIRLRMSELVMDTHRWPISTVGEEGLLSYGNPNVRLCQFGIRNVTGQPFILGDTFLRSAYIVHDLVNHEVGIAPTVFNATSSDILAFSEYGERIS